MRDSNRTLSPANSYRMYIVDRSDTGAGNFDLVYQYESMTYDTRVLSPGSNPIELHARAGYSNGSGVAGTFYNFPRSGLTGMAASLSTTTPYVFPIRNNRLFDLDIDSDNTNGNSNPDFSPIEELTEGIDGDAQHPGKVLWVNSGDADSDESDVERQSTANHPMLVFINSLPHHLTLLSLLALALFPFTFRPIGYSERALTAGV